MRKIKNSAFTLIELLVVISVIGILAMLAMVSYTNAQKQARDTQRKNDLAQYQAALETYSAKNDSLYPVYAGVNITDTFCDEIGAASCPSDPDPDKSYFYVSDGLTYNLTAELESKEANWVVDSSGGTSEISTASPLPEGTSTPVATVTPTSTPTQTAIPTETPEICTGCYSYGVCYPGNEENRCGNSGGECENCSLLNEYGITYLCEPGGYCRAEDERQ